MQMKLKPNPKSIQTHKQSQSVNFLWGEMISFYEESVKQRLLVILSFVGISWFWQLDGSQCSQKVVGAGRSRPGVALKPTHLLHGRQHLLGFLTGHTSRLLERLFEGVAHAGWHLFSAAARKHKEDLKFS